MIARSHSPDRRQFIPPHLFRSVCDFAIREVMSHGIGDGGEFDFTVLDCLQVALLYPRNPSSFRLPEASGIARLYNAYADLQETLRIAKGGHLAESLITKGRPPNDY